MVVVSEGVFDGWCDNTSMAQTIDPAAVARDAASRQSWREAFEAYEKLDQAGLSAEDLERYGEAAWWSGKLGQAIRLRERAYVGLLGRREGSRRRAGRAHIVLGRVEPRSVLRRAGLVRHRRAPAREPGGIRRSTDASHSPSASNAMFAEGKLPALPSSTSTTRTSSRGASATGTRRCLRSPARGARS